MNALDPTMSTALNTYDRPFSTRAALFQNGSDKSSYQRASLFNADAGKSDGIPSHTIHGVTWIDAPKLAIELGNNLSYSEDILAPVAAINLDNIRMSDNVEYLSTQALVTRLRMNDVSRSAALMYIKIFLNTAIGEENYNVDVQIDSKYRLDIYVPKAKLSIDVNSGTLVTSKDKVNYLRQHGIYHIEFNIKNQTIRNASSRNGAIRLDVEIMLMDTLPELFQCLISQYRAGNLHDSASVHGYIKKAYSTELDKEISQLKRRLEQDDDIIRACSRRKIGQMYATNRYRGGINTGRKQPDRVYLTSAINRLRAARPTYV